MDCVGNGTYNECDVCHSVFSCPHDLQMHMQVHHKCGECGRYFRNAHDLMQHSQVHRPRTTPCPACGQMYRSAADAVLHFETGHCSACRGQDNARRAVYDFASARQRLRERSHADSLELKEEEGKLL